MKVITKAENLYRVMDARRKAKRWIFNQLDEAVGSKTSFSQAIAGVKKGGKPIDMKITSLLRLLDALDLEMVIRRKEPPPPALRKYVPTDALPSGAASPTEGPGR